MTARSLTPQAASRLNRAQLDLDAERQRLAAEVAATIKQREELLADANAVKALGTLTQVGPWRHRAGGCTGPEPHMYSSSACGVSC